jgi:hypothetical protein
MVRRKLLLACALPLLLAACVLPEFDKISAAPEDGGGPPDARKEPGLSKEGACGLSNQLPTACDACIREKCCAEAMACGEGTACGEDLLEPITPLADFSEDFDPLLACMQKSCDAACEVNWGCVDNYSWPAAKAPVDIELKVIDFAGEDDNPRDAIAGVKVQACDAVDPSCTSGLKAEGVTDDAGMVTLSGLAPNFSGFYTFSGGSTRYNSDYVPGVVQWNEPIHRAGGFTQYQVTETAVGALAVFAGVHEKTDDPFDPGLGFLIVRIQGCLPMRYLNRTERPISEVDNVRLSFSPSDGATRIFYTSTSGSVAVSLDKTTTDGVGGAFNITPASVTVTAVDTLTDREVASGNVQVNAGGIGFMFLLPRAR